MKLFNFFYACFVDANINIKTIQKGLKLVKKDFLNIFLGFFRQSLFKK